VSEHTRNKHTKKEEEIKENMLSAEKGNEEV